MTHRGLRLTTGLLLAALAAGCSSSSPYLSGRTRIGTLKASVAQLEHERNQYQAKVAELEQENRRITDKLAQERDANGELTARLDDARVLLGQQGLTTRPTADSQLDRPATPAASPRRSPPFAQIGGIRAVPYPDDPPIAPPADDIPPPARTSEMPIRWLPVAE